MAVSEISPGDVFALETSDTRVKLQINSDRRAIVDFIVAQGGTASIETINVKFGFDCRRAVVYLLDNGWLVRVEA